MTKRISLIHVTPVAIKPINDAFSALWPEATLNNLLDDSISMGLSQGASKESLKRQFLDLARYAQNNGADAILFTCSAFGEILDECKNELDIPILKPNEAMVNRAAQKDGKIALLATFEPAIESIKAELMDAANEHGTNIEVQAFAAPKALSVLKENNDLETHDALIADLVTQATDCDIICFSQFSMSSALRLSEKNTSKPILTTPESAVLQIKALLS